MSDMKESDSKVSKNKMAKVKVKVKLKIPMSMGKNGSMFGKGK